MKLIINDVKYDITDSIQGATLGDLMKLKVKTKTPEFLGVTAKFISDTLIGLGRRMKDDPDFETLELLGDEDFLNAVCGLIYLARRKAGQVLEPSDAMDTAFDTFFFDSDDDDDDEESPGDDPKALGVPDESNAPTTLTT